MTERTYSTFSVRADAEHGKPGLQLWIFGQSNPNGTHLCAAHHLLTQCFAGFCHAGTQLLINDARPRRESPLIV